MSHNHHHDDEGKMAGIVNNDSATHRRRSYHTHRHLNPTVVFDHIKTKVKRHRSSNNALLEIPPFALNNNKNGNSDSRRPSQEHDEIELKTATRPSPITLSHTKSDQYSDDNNDNKHNEEKNAPLENDATVVSDQIDRDEDVNEDVQLKIEPDIDISKKKTKSKTKAMKILKPSASLNQCNEKIRRQTTRRAGFQIRDEDFNSIFNELPSHEQLIVAYPCAWQKDTFMHGRLFLSVNYVCFYTSFFQWEESLCIAYKDIVSVTREKSTEVLPNAIKLRTNNREQYLFASYIPRERIFITIFRLWKNTILEKPLGYQQLRATVNNDQMSIDESSGDSEESIGLGYNYEHSSNRRLHSHSLSVISDRSGELPTPASSILSEQGVFFSSSLDKEQTNYLSACPCETHLTRTYSDRLFSYHVDKIFELIFGENSFARAYRDSQKLTDYTIGEWRINNETGKRERQVTYKATTQSILGTNTISCNEKQTIEAEKPHLMYVINSEVNNEGMKYTDAFYVATRYCMFQRDAKHSTLRLSAEIKYIKNVNGIARAFIDKNANSSIEDNINSLIRKLEHQQAAISTRTLNKKQTSVAKQCARKKKYSDTNRDEKKDDSTLNFVVSPEHRAKTKHKTLTGKGFFYDIAIFIGIVLLLVHIYLSYILYSVDRSLHTPDATCMNECKKTCLENKIHQ